MSLNSTPSGERVHIAFFGCRNAGKSSLVNAFTGQQLAIVSEIKGTTTDPVRKAMELLPLGPVVIIDTPGIDDEGSLGQMRIERARNVLNQTDIVVLVVDASREKCQADEDLLKLFSERNIPYIIAMNKADLVTDDPEAGEHEIYVSALTGANIRELKEKTAVLMKDLPKEHPLVGDLVSPGDKVVLVIPIDKSAPKGRLILPQQQVIRDLLDHGAMPVMCRDMELEETLNSLKKAPSLVITDSQVFKYVSDIVPEEIPLTSFSILMARHKGILIPSINGAKILKEIKDGDTILISEGCTHHRQCEDIGTVKLPGMIKRYTGADFRFETTSGTEFPNDLSRYKMILHCGACMLGPNEAASRYAKALEQGIPITNYGIAIAQMTGILDRAISMITT